MRHNLLALTLLLICTLFYSITEAKTNQWFSDNTAKMPSLAQKYALFKNTGGIGSNLVSIAELTGDKYPELIFHLWQNQEKFGVNTSSNVPNRLIILSRNKAGIYTDIAEKLTYPQKPILNGASRQSRIGDINGDGFMDVAWSVNQEDGRSTVDLSTIEAQTNILLSKGIPGHYELKTIGSYNWFHAIALAPAINNQPGIVLPLGFTWKAQALIYNSTDFLEEPLPTELPIAAGTSRHLPSLDGSDSRFFYINAMNYSGPASPAILQRKGNGLWQIASRYDGALTKSTTAQYTTWSHDESATFLYQCKLGWCMGGGGDIEVNLWRPYPHSNPIIISKSSVMIPLVDPLSNHIIEGVNTYTGEYHNFYTFTDSSIQPVDISISGEIHKITSSFEDVIDVDGDGYEDLVEYPLNTTTGLPIVYINNKSGGLIYEDLSPYISIQKPFGGWGGLDSKLLDANADGIMDILFFPESSSVQNAKSAKKYLLFLGRKKLKLN